MVGMVHARIRFDGVLAYFYYLKQKGVRLGSVRCAVLCYGLPGIPPARYHPLVERLVEKGFLVACPEYPGTYGSFGKCNFENAAEAVVKTIEFLRRGKAVELRDLKKLRWKAKEIILVGGSFGGSVALVAGAKSDAVRKIIAIAPVTDYRGRKRTARRNRPYIERGLANLWRVEKSAWGALAKGGLDINPIDYAPELADKEVFLVHGDCDDTVGITQSTRLLEAMRGGRGKHGLVVMRGEGHGIAGMFHPKAVREVMKFVNKAVKI
jgi:dipeptidyl aminopeptidase/acylaminoacyl peptidase